MKRALLILISVILCLSSIEVQSQKRAAGKRETGSKSVSIKKVKKSSKKSSKVVGKGGSVSYSNAEIKGLRGEQAKIRQSIRRQEQALRANKAAVQQKLQDIQRLGSDVTRHQQSIDSINRDIIRINSNIGILNSQLSTLTSQLAERKSSYVKSMRYMAKHRGIKNQLMFIFSGKDLSQVFRRLRFVRQYAAYQRSQGKALQIKQGEVTNKRSQLGVVKGEKSTMLAKGTEEKRALEEKRGEQQKIVSSLKGQQKVIQSVIDEQRKKDAVLNAQIDHLVSIEVEKARQRAIAEAKKKAEQAAIAKAKAEELSRKKAEAEAKARENARRIAEAKAAEERAKAEARAAAAAARQQAAKERAEAAVRAEQLAREAEANRIAAERKAAADKKRSEHDVAVAAKEKEEFTTLSSVDRMLSGGFEANKGRMPSPLSGGRIVSHFGQHGVEGLPGVVLDNKGINILGSPGAAVHSIYDGEVSAVFNVGGSMGVLIRHGAYISVYCNLRSVSVARGQKVSVRQAIGTVGRDNILQFQLRKERSKLNPEQWLSM